MSGGRRPARKRFVVGLIGGGIGPSLTPALHELEADALGLSYAYQLIDIDALGLAASDVGQLLAEARRMGFSGVNITHPCKQVVLEHVDELSDTARALGAANTVVFADGVAVGHNTDEPAFRHSFRTSLAGAAIDNVVIVGAGGGGAAVSHAMLTLAAGRVILVDIERARADELAASLRPRFRAASIEAHGPEELERALALADGVINATPVGMAGHPGIPFSASLLSERLWVADIVYRPLDTELLRSARTKGCTTLDGGSMAVIQAAESFALFTGIEPNVARMFEEFGQLLGAVGESGLAAAESSVL